MCGIAGFCDPKGNFFEEEGKWNHILDKMNRIQKRRGPDDQGTYLDRGCGLAHVRLEIIDLVTGHQPMIHTDASGTYAIVYNGEIYNMPELKRELEKEGAVFRTASDTEVILQGFMLHGEEYLKKLNGIFAIALWDSHKKRLCLSRDRLGIKPLFYTWADSSLVFSSEIKGLFAYPGVTPELDREGLCEVFALGPAKSYGKGVFKGVYEVLPGHCLTLDGSGVSEHAYWKLESRPHTDSFEKTVEKTAWLVEDAVKKQMLSDIPISTFLSGGVDSSLVTSICAADLKKQ